MGRPRKIQNTETGDIATGKVSVEIISADMALALKNAGLATSH